MNWNIFFPTSTILKSKPIFQTDLSVDLKALMFWCLSASSRPNRLSSHSSKRFELPEVDIEISSSSSLVSWRCCNPSMTSWSLTAKANDRLIKCHKNYYYYYYYYYYYQLMYKSSLNLYYIFTYYKLLHLVLIYLINYLFDNCTY